MDFLSYLKTLKPEDWEKKVNDTWTVKDVVAHMVGWEKGDPESIRKAWETEEPPWWMRTKDYDDFNKKAVEYYEDYSPRQLINEWERWQGKVREEIDRIGEDKLRARPDLFCWLFEKGGDSHYNHHYRQIKKVVGSEPSESH